MFFCHGQMEVFGKQWEAQYSIFEVWGLVIYLLSQTKYKKHWTRVFSFISNRLPLPQTWEMKTTKINICKCWSSLRWQTMLSVVRPGVTLGKKFHLISYFFDHHILSCWFFNSHTQVGGTWENLLSSLPFLYIFSEALHTTNMTFSYLKKEPFAAFLSFFLKK